MMRVVREPVEFETPIGEAEEFKMGDVINDDAPLEGAYGLNYFFFFQAEDGIRDKLVTEVQTCALPIYQLFAKRHQAGCDIWIFVAERPRMHAGHEESRRVEILQAAIADERDIEVTGARSIGVERGLVLPTMTGDGAAAQDAGRARRREVGEQPAERFETIAAPAERQPNHIVPLGFFRQATLKFDVARRVSHTAEHSNPAPRPIRWFTQRRHSTVTSIMYK